VRGVAQRLADLLWSAGDQLDGGMQMFAKKQRQFALELRLCALRNIGNDHQQLAVTPGRKLLAAGSQQQTQADQYRLQTSFGISHVNILHEIEVAGKMRAAIG